jgi:hypothetical protein
MGENMVEHVKLLAALFMAAGIQDKLSDTAIWELQSKLLDEQCQLRGKIC